MDDQQVSEEEQARLARMSPAENAPVFNPRYSKFIRWMRLVLPMIALALAAIVFTWSSFKSDDFTPPPAQNMAENQRVIGKNELINPRFESKDTKDQPFTITAARAVQDKDNQDLVALEKPMADMLLSGGNWVAIEAREGTYLQNSQQLALHGAVKLFHDAGYHMELKALQVDLATRTASSQTDVYAQGPAGTLEAKGLQADAQAGTLVFTGPARLVLTRAEEDKGWGEIFDE